MRACRLVCLTFALGACDDGATGDDPTHDVGAIDGAPVADGGAGPDGAVGPDALAPDAAQIPDSGFEPVEGFETLSAQAWDATAVRQVLHVFAFGGFAADAQITAWAAMEPEVAITEMLTFDELNPKLAPTDEGLPTGGLRAMAAYWASAAGPIDDAEDRAEYELSHWVAPVRAWFTAATRAGANPFRQRIGLFETNDHLAVNQNAGVNNWQIFRYYDDVCDALAAGLPYEEVLAVAAGAAAVAQQYNHKENRFEDARFRGNEDFARELHQLFFRILGTDEPEYHELTTIRNTAKALTDMRVGRVGEGDDEHDDEVVVFGEQFHYPAELEIFHTEVPGPTAAARIALIVALDIAHAESLANLPVFIIRRLADDALGGEREAAVRSAWAGMERKELLRFLRAYAISTTFHHPERLKLWSSVERNVLYSNLNTLLGLEVHERLYEPRYAIEQEGVRVFRPMLNVFGGQTGAIAAASGAVFQQAYNNSTDRYWFFARTEEDGLDWRRDWAAVVPPAGDGTHRVKGVAEWLWQRHIADGLRHFGALERAHVYALLGAGVDLSLFIDDQNPGAVYTEAELTTRADLLELVHDMEIAIMPLGDPDPDAQETVNFRIGQAVNFIVATPYAFVQEGR